VPDSAPTQSNVMYVWLARREEAEMERGLGDDYRAYTIQVPQFMPRLSWQWPTRHP